MSEIVKLYIFQLILFLAYLSIPCFLVVYFTRHRAKWGFYDFSITILPFTCWYFTFILNRNKKSLSNLSEWLILLIIVPIFLLTRGLLGKNRFKITISIALTALACAAAIALAVIVPCWPE